MSLVLDAACGSHRGLERTQNSDNFYFDDRCLRPDSRSLRHPVTMRRVLDREVCTAVFDGMGEESFGGQAAFAAAEALRDRLRLTRDYVMPEKQFLKETCALLDRTVLEAAAELGASTMGTTMTALYFSCGFAYVCDLGNSRAYRLRGGEFLQVSAGRGDASPSQAGKPPVSRGLGFSAGGSEARPHIAKGELRPGDRFLLCSDGLTDVLNNCAIDGILMDSAAPAEAVSRLIDAALENGGRDNVTVIVCDVEKE